jgi:type II secretory pathway component PulM
VPPFFDQPSPSTAGSWPAYAQLRVHLGDAAGRSLPRSLVALRRANGHTGPDLPCRYDVRAGCYIGPAVTPGEYLLITQSRGFIAHRRRVQLSAGMTETTVLLGTSRSPGVARGGTLVTLTAAEPARVAVQLDSAVDDSARQLLDAARALRLEPRLISRELARAGVLVFELPAAHHLGSTPSVQHERLRSVLSQLARTPGVRHAGAVVHAAGNSVAFLTHDVVVRLSPAAAPQAIQALAAAHGFDVVRLLPFGARLWQLRTDEMPTPALLARMEALRDDADVEWAEPSLVVAGGAEAPPSAERAPRDPADADLARLPAALAMLEHGRNGMPTAAPVVAVVGSHGVDVWNASGPTGQRRRAVGSDLDLAELLAGMRQGDHAADIVVLLPALGATLPPSNTVHAALDALTHEGRAGRGVVVLTPHVVVAESDVPRLVAIEQPLALHAGVQVVNATAIDATGEECRTPGVGGSMHVAISAPARQPPSSAAPTAATLLVADIVQAMLATNPQLSAADVRRILRATAERIDPQQTAEDGAWLDARGVEARTAGTLPVFSQWYGYGRVDAVRAVAAAQSRRVGDQSMVPRLPVESDRPSPLRAAERPRLSDLPVGGGLGFDSAVSALAG